MLGRENCQMCSVWNNEVYCDYYDFLVAKCEDIEDCPDGLDDEPEYYEGDDYDYEDDSEQIIF